uniref:Uncharacterized protein n=1 Tax=Ciona intestinalis TaxID=7719 RepID=H2XR51_CIOIN
MKETHYEQAKLTPSTYNQLKALKKFLAA